jgi:uncharacterized protein YodC (DUF2158 family)
MGITLPLEANQLEAMPEYRPEKFQVNYAVGDSVRLNWGGAAMIVESIDAPDEMGIVWVHCRRFEGNGCLLGREKYPSSTLAKISGGEP